MEFEGGGYLASGKFKCLFDNEDYVEYLSDDHGQKIGNMRCFRGKATIIAEKAEFDSEQTFAQLLHKTMSPSMLCLAYATLALIPNKRYNLSSGGVDAFRRISKVSSQNCKDLFVKPTQLQAVCMDQGIPLSGSTVIQDIWTQMKSVVTDSSSGPTCELVAPLISEYLCSTCLGLKVLQDSGILHGDIKANNILLYTVPQPIRRFEIDPDASETSTDVLGRRLRYQIIDFGKHQTLDQFVRGGFRAFTRKSMRAWYNPLCLGVHLMDKETSGAANSEQSGSDSDAFRQATIYKLTRGQELARWLPELFQQIDKYAFMYILWQILYSSYTLGNKERQWDSNAFNKSLLTLIESCARPVPAPLDQALARASEEPWIFQSDFRKHMVDHSFVWFCTWDEIYVRVRAWSKRWNRKMRVVPKTLRDLAAFASPSLTIQPIG